jgi:hypothetical protein
MAKAPPYDVKPNDWVIYYSPTVTFGERFCHSGNPAAVNTQLIKSAGFEIISDLFNQPGNQVILARKIK